ncbi:MAG TPA: CBS domain-containing protein [Abditibacteriaceae bacterium]|jgi:CBS domain-containing protein
MRVDTPTPTSDEQKQHRAIIVSLLFLLTGFIVLWLTKTLIKIEGEAVLISLLLIPAFVYVIVSGRIKEFKGPGGFEATFFETASQSVNIATEKIEPSVAEMQVVAKEGVRALERKRQELNEAHPTIMTLTLGEISNPSNYNRQDVLTYLEFLSQLRNFKFVVIMDRNKSFVAYMPHWALKGLLDNPNLGHEFIDLVNNGGRENLLRFPGIIRKTISTQTTNVEALREMTNQNLEALVVIDEHSQLKGVVEREQILSRMMLALAA